VRSRAVWAVTVALAALAVLGWTLTPAPHSGGDNASYLSLGHSLATGGGYVEHWDPEGAPHTKYPPVFPTLLALLVLAGASSWTAYKLLMIGLVSLAVTFVFTWASGRRGPIAGAAVAGLTLLSAGWLDAARWILSEPLFLVCTFLALWAADRAPGRLPALRNELRRVIGASGASGDADARALGRADRTEDPKGPNGPRSAKGPKVPQGPDESGRGGVAPGIWLALAGAGALLAFFTRSAGLPLVLALFFALVFLRAWRQAGVFAATVALPGLAWYLRARRGTGEGAYQSEFWLVNPYEPELGTLGWLGLPGRVWANLGAYGLDVLPAQWWGVGATGGAFLGVVIGGLAFWGWTLRIRLGAGVAELFVPAYLGLILLWPEVWTGERFFLPLLPVVLLYAGEAVRYAALPLGRLGAPVAVALTVLILAVPALPGWMAVMDEAAQCRSLARSGDVFRCHGPAFQEFRNASAWIGVNLPANAVVLNRKPSIHYLLGGRPGRIFEFTLDPSRFLADADRIGARYVLFDHIDGISPYYLGGIVHAQPLAFCYIAGWGGGTGVPGTDLLGILPASGRVSGGDPTQIEVCSREYLEPLIRDPSTEGTRIPRFVGSPPARIESLQSRLPADP